MINVLVYGSLFNGRGDIVDEIVKGLRKNFYVDWIDPGIYIDRSVFNRSKSRSINMVKYFPIKKDYKFVFFLSGGYFPSQSLLSFFKENSTEVISWQLSDPDDFERRGKFLIDHCDLMVTNSSESYEKYKLKKNSLLLDFACNKFTDLASESNIVSDYIVVGEYRPDRLELLSGLTSFKGAIYGRSWDSIVDSKKLWLVNEVTQIAGAAKYKEINSSRMYISFGKTLAGGNNLKVGFFEALSVGAVIATDSNLDPLESKYGKIPHVFKFNSHNDLFLICSKISKLSRQKLISMRRDNLEYFERNHTWANRINEIIREFS